VNTCEIIVAQAKPAGFEQCSKTLPATEIRNLIAPPPAFRPQAAAAVVQPSRMTGNEGRRLGTAPPAYRPQGAPPSVQPKPAHVRQIAQTGMAPPVYRPLRSAGIPPMTVAQLKLGGSPPVYCSKPTAVQTKNPPATAAVPPNCAVSRTNQAVVAAAQSKSVAVNPLPRKPMNQPWPTASVHRPLGQRRGSPPVFRANSNVVHMMPDAGIAVLTTKLGYDYADAEAFLYAEETTELDNLWESSYRVTANTSKTQKRLRAGAAADTVAARLNAILAIPTVTYSANFKTNHVSDGDVDTTTAKTRGEARNPLPRHNTVLKESYLRGLLVADANGKADGNHWLRFQSPTPAAGKISLASNDVWRMKAEDTGLYFVAVRYSLSTTVAKRPKTINAFHIETDDD
jgi:hypothetical protein